MKTETDNREVLDALAAAVRAGRFHASARVTGNATLRRRAGEWHDEAARRLAKVGKP